MKKALIFAAMPVALSLAACGETASDDAAAASVADDDNDAPEPVADDHHDEGDEHDESVPHEH